MPSMPGPTAMRLKLKVLQRAQEKENQEMAAAQEKQQKELAAAQAEQARKAAEKDKARQKRRRNRQNRPEKRLLERARRRNTDGEEEESDSGNESGEDEQQVDSSEGGEQDVTGEHSGEEKAAEQLDEDDNESVSDDIADEKRELWLKKKAIIQGIATQHVALHVTTTQYDFWARYLMATFPAMPTLERAARLRELEELELAFTVDFKGFSDKWDSYHHFRQNKLKSLPKDLPEFMMEVTKKYHLVKGRLDEIPDSARRVLGLPALGPRFPGFTLSVPTNCDQPTEAASTQKTNVFSPRKLTAAATFFSRLPAQPTPVPTGNVFAQQAPSTPSIFDKLTPSSTGASAHPTSVMGQAPAASSTPAVEFAFTKPGCVPSPEPRTFKYKPGIYGGEKMRPATPKKSAEIEQAAEDTLAASSTFDPSKWKDLSVGIKKQPTTPSAPLPIFGVPQQQLTTSNNLPVFGVSQQQPVTLGSASSEFPTETRSFELVTAERSLGPPVIGYLNTFGRPQQQPTHQASVSTEEEAVREQGHCLTPEEAKENLFLPAVDTDVQVEETEENSKDESEVVKDIVSDHGEEASQDQETIDNAPFHTLTYTSSEFCENDPEPDEHAQGIDDDSIPSHEVIAFSPYVYTAGEFFNDYINSRYPNLAWEEHDAMHMDMLTANRAEYNSEIYHKNGRPIDPEAMFEYMADALDLARAAGHNCCLFNEPPRSLEAVTLDLNGKHDVAANLTADDNVSVEEVTTAAAQSANDVEGATSVDRILSAIARLRNRRRQSKGVSEQDVISKDSDVSAVEADVAIVEQVDETVALLKEENPSPTISIFQQANATAYKAPANISAHLERSASDTDDEEPEDEFNDDDAHSEAAEDIAAPDESTTGHAADDTVAVEEEMVAAAELAEDNKDAVASADHDDIAVVVKQGHAPIEIEVIAPPESAEDDVDAPAFVETRVPSPMMAVTEYKIQYDNDENLGYINGYEYLVQRDRELVEKKTIAAKPTMVVVLTHEIQYDDDVPSEQVCGYEYILSRDRDLPDPEDELSSSDDDEDSSDDDSVSVGTGLTSPMLGSGADKGLEVDRETAEPYLLELYGYSPKFTGATEDNDEDLVFDGLDELDHDSAIPFIDAPIEEQFVPLIAFSDLAEFGYTTHITDADFNVPEKLDVVFDDGDWALDALDALAEVPTDDEVAPEIPELELDLTPLSSMFDEKSLFLSFHDSPGEIIVTEKFLEQEQDDHESRMIGLTQLLKQVKLEIISVDDEPKAEQVPQQQLGLSTITAVATEMALGGDGLGVITVDDEPEAEPTAQQVDPSTPIVVVTEPAPEEDGPKLQTVMQGDLQVTGRAPRTVHASLSSTGNRDVHLQGPKQYPRQYSARPIPHRPREVATNMGTNERGEPSPFEVSEK
jgi:hypothetical protein